MGFYQKGKYNNPRQSISKYRRKVNKMRKLFPNTKLEKVKEVSLKELVG